MVITNLGEGAFRLQSGETSLLIDPSGNRLKADVILKTVASAAEIPSEPEVIYFAGEYEMKGIEVEGMEVVGESTEKEIKTIYAVNFEDVRFAIFGAISSLPEVKAMEKIGIPDVIILPVNEDHFLSSDDAEKLVKQLSPSVIIPALYDKKSLDKFAKNLGQKVSPEEKFVFKKKDLVPEEGKLIILEPRQ